MYPFLAKFGEFESYKETVIYQIWKIDKFVRESQFFGDEMSSDIDICVSQIEHPKMSKYVTDTLEQQVKSSERESFLLNHYKICDLWYYAQMYHLLTGTAAINHQGKNNTIEIGNLLQLLLDCPSKYEATFESATTYCPLIAFAIYESRKDGINDGINGHEYVLNAIKCIISNHDLYYSKFGSLTNEMEYKFKSKLTNILRQSLSAAVFYPYL